MDKLREFLTVATSSTSTEITVLFKAHSILFDALSMIGEEYLQVDSALDERIKTALEMMESNLKSPYTNIQLAKIVSMNPCGFIRLFSEELGNSPQKYYKKIRIDAASLLLHFSKKSVEEIAAETGFVDRYHFSREFKKFQGLPPALFRNRFRH
jgi:transcriptional regulator GlxA family with amidase domain